MTRILPGIFRKSKWRRTVRWRAEATCLRLFWLLVGPMGPVRASATGRKLFQWLGPRLRRQKKVRRNLRIAFPRLKGPQLDTLAREIWGNFGAVLAEYPHLHRFGATRPRPEIELVIDEETRPFVEGRNAAVYVTAHLANWELAACAIARTGVPLSVVYAPQDNPFLERMLQARRQSLGCRFIARKNAMRKSLGELHAGRAVGLLPDQRVDSGQDVPFFGRNSPTTTSPAWLAFRSNCPLIPIQIERCGDARYRAIFHRPILSGESSGDQQGILQVTAVINRLFEEWIQRCPGQWLCLRRRWPAAVHPSMNP